jgi:hypothetical protein
MVLRELDTRESAIPSPLASYPTRAASHSANLGALFGSRTNISRSVSYLWFAQHLRHLSSSFRQASPAQCSQRRRLSAILAYAVVDPVILLTYVAVEGRLT